MILHLSTKEKKEHYLNDRCASHYKVPKSEILHSGKVPSSRQDLKADSCAQQVTIMLPSEFARIHSDGHHPCFSNRIEKKIIKAGTRNKIKMQLL